MPATHSSSGLAGFPTAVYPAPVPSAVPNGVLARCPNPTVLAAVPASARSAAVAAAQGFNTVSLDTDLRNADRSLWPDIQSMWSKPDRGHGGSLVISVTPWGTHPQSEDFVLAACGHQLGLETVIVALGPPEALQGPGPHCLACITRFFFISRAGRTLLYVVYP